MKPDNPIILALDVPTMSEALAWVQKTRHQIQAYKIGMQLFYRYGPEIVRRVQEEGSDIFLDLKLHDIPNTVAHAVESILLLNVQLLTVHLSGGRTMLQAAQNVVTGSDLRLLGVSALTSMDANTLQEVFPGSGNISPSDWALDLAGLAVDVGLYGLVCSAQENQGVQSRYGQKLALVNPGIRPAGTDHQDQKRVMTPELAMASGASYLVIGRPILQARDPLQVIGQIREEIAHAVGLSAK